MKIHLARQGDDLQVYIDELCIVVRGRYRRRPLGLTKRRSLPLINIYTFLSASKNLDDGETTVLKDTYQAKMENNIDRAISAAMSEIPKEEKRNWLNESIKKHGHADSAKPAG